MFARLQLSAQFSTSLSLFLCLALGSAAPPARAAPTYSVTVLGGAGNVASAINNSGQVVGQLLNGSDTRGFIWSGGTLTELGTLGGAYSYAYAINDAGQVAGASANAANMSRAYVYAGGVMQDLGAPAATAGAAYGINNAGLVVGSSTYGTNDGQPWPGQAARYSGGTVQYLGILPGGEVSDAVAVNSGGQAVGRSFIEPGGAEFPYHAALYSGGAVTDLGTLGGLYSYATSINDLGQIVGGANTSDFHVSHVFLYENGTMSDLGTLGGEYGAGLDINQQGQVVGFAAIDGGLGRGFLYRGSGALVDLNSLIDPAAGWVISDAVGINDHQQIAANGCRAGQCHALLLNPVPEPAAYAMLLLGLGWIAFAAHRSRVANP